MNVYVSDKAQTMLTAQPYNATQSQNVAFVRALNQMAKSVSDTSYMECDSTITESCAEGYLLFLLLIVDFTPYDVCTCK